MAKNHKEINCPVLKKFLNSLALALILIYSLLIATYSYRYYPVGQYMNVEHDFYNWYAPDTKQILNGNLWSIEFYDLKGIGYHLILALFTFFTGDIFKSGNFISIISSGISLFLIYKIFSRIFNPILGILTILGTMVNNFFIISSYTVGTDMFFLSLVLAAISSLYFKRVSKSYQLLFSGFFSGYAYFTRYNGLFLVFPVLLYIFFLDKENTELKRKVKDSIFYLSSFLLAIIPWHIFLYFKTGNFFFNRSYRNLVYDFIYEGNTNKDFYWQYLADNFHSSTEVFLYDPISFLSKLLEHAVSHFNNQMNSLLFSLPIKYFVLLGIIYFLITETRKLSKRQISFFSFAIGYYLIMLFIHYEDRYFIFLVPFFIFFAANLFLNILNNFFTGKIYLYFKIAAFIVLLFYSSTNAINFNLKRATWLPTEILYFGDFLKYFSNENDLLIARSPNLTFYAGVKYREMPLAPSVDELVNFALKKKARFIYFSNLELKFRPKVGALLYHNSKHPLLYPIMEMKSENKRGVLYYINSDYNLNYNSTGGKSPLFEEKLLRDSFLKNSKDKKWILEAKGLLMVPEKGFYTLSFSGEGLRVAIDGENLFSSTDIVVNSSYHKRKIFLEAGYHSINISVEVAKTGIFPSGLFWEKPDGKREIVSQKNLIIEKSFFNGAIK